MWIDAISLCPELNPLVIVQERTRPQHDRQLKDIFEFGGSGGWDRFMGACEEWQLRLLCGVINAPSLYFELDSEPQ